MSSAPTADLTRSDGSPLRVLVVDDEVNIAELISMALRYEGWQVQMAHTGSSAVNTALEQGPDAVVLDMMLPDIDGRGRITCGDWTCPAPPSRSPATSSGCTR